MPGAIIGPSADSGATLEFGSPSSQAGSGFARKLAGPEKSILDDSDLEFHRREYERLRAELEAAHLSCKLPEVPSARPALNDLLVRLRVRSIA